MENNIIKKQTEALEGLYNHFNQKYFEGKLPSIALTIQTKGRKEVYGWCTVGQVWQQQEKVVEGEKEKISVKDFFEINLAAEHMNRGVYDVTATLIHEMVHLSNLCKGIKDCNPKTQNHNKHFKEEAERVGLIVEKVEKRGWARTSLSPELENEINELVEVDVFNAARVNLEQPQKKRKASKPKITYMCKCGTEFKSTKDLNLICADCNELFEKFEE